jgi:hypothetical protein
MIPVFHRNYCIVYKNRRWVSITINSKLVFIDLNKDDNNLIIDSFYTTRCPRWGGYFMTFIHKVILIGLLVALVAMGVGVVTAENQQGPLTELRLTPDPDAEPGYGRSVAMGSDLIAVGDGGDGSIGAVYVYKRLGTIYVFEKKLDFPEAIPEDCLDARQSEDPEDEFGLCPEFGRTVGIEGNTVFVGARFAPVGDLHAGAVYVFQKQGSFWTYEGKIVSPAPEAEDNFGRALAVQGNLLVVTARKENLEANDVGSAYVYLYEEGEWVYHTKLTASDATPGAYFGQSVAVQGENLVIGARNADPKGAGGFYLFRGFGEDWTEVAKITPPNGKNNDQYGFSIEISGDTVVVGARRMDQSNTVKDTGAAFIYSLKEGSPELVTKLTASDAMPFDEFGQSVAIAGDVIAVGAWKDDLDAVNEKTGLGSIYLFRQKGGQWIQTGKIMASDGEMGDEFGYSLSAFGNRMVTGAHKADFIFKDGGAAYVFPLKS